MARCGVARKPREDVAGAIHHVYARGIDGRRIYRDDVDRHVYLRMLGRVVRRLRWRVLAYCLMSNHLHLLVETPEANLGSGMQWLHGRYGQRYNERHGTAGHVFQGRYGAVRVTSDPQLVTVVDYIARNPVDAGLCERAEEWAWSSHAAIEDGAVPSWLDTNRLREYVGSIGGART
jgi:REP-associated tyrosine transposase